MSRWLSLALLLAPAVAYADQVAVPAAVAPPDMSDQASGASVGVATGGRVTAGGLRIAGHYLYQLSDRDWFDGTAAFTFGGGTAACFHDRTDAFIGGHGQFWPFLLGGIGLRGVDFSADSVNGFGLAFHAGGGIRAAVTSGVAITAQGELELGFGAFNHSLGIQPLLGVASSAGVEFWL